MLVHVEYTGTNQTFSVKRERWHEFFAVWVSAGYSNAQALLNRAGYHKVSSVYDPAMDSHLFARTGTGFLFASAYWLWRRLK